MKKNKIFWGILIIACAVLLLLNGISPSLGFPELPFWRIALAIVLLFVAISLIIERNAAWIPLPLVLIFLLFEKQIAGLLGIGSGDIISNWLAVGIAVLLSVGISLLTSHSKRKGKSIHVGVDGGGKSTTFNDATFYVDASELGKREFHGTFGDMEIFVENVSAYKGGGVLVLNSTFGDVRVHVPDDWDVKVESHSTFGDVSVRNPIQPYSASLTIKSNRTFGDLEIVSP